MTEQQRSPEGVPRYGVTVSIGEVNELGRGVVIVKATTARGIVLELSVSDVVEEGVSEVRDALLASVPDVLLRLDPPTATSESSEA